MAYEQKECKPHNIFACSTVMCPGIFNCAWHKIGTHYVFVG